MSAPIETIIRVARLPEGLRPVPIFSGDPPEPIDASWVAVSFVPEHAQSPARFLLYFVSEVGDLRECLQFETLEIALDQARSIAGLSRSAWRSCSVQYPDTDRLDPTSFPL